MLRPSREQRKTIVGLGVAIAKVDMLIAITTLEYGAKNVSWLLAAPISQGEREFLE